MSWHILKQPSKVVMQKDCSENIRKIHRKTAVAETFFSRFTDLQRENLLKKIPTTGVFMKTICKLMFSEKTEQTGTLSLRQIESN